MARAALPDTRLQKVSEPSNLPPDQNSAYVDVDYQYLPDDRNGTVVSVHLRAQIKDVPWATSRPRGYQGGDWPPPARTGEAFNAGGALLTPEEFLTLAENPDAASAVGTVNGFLHLPTFPAPPAG